MLFANWILVQSFMNYFWVYVQELKAVSSQKLHYPTHLQFKSDLIIHSFLYVTIHAFSYINHLSLLLLMHRSFSSLMQYSRYLTNGFWWSLKLHQMISFACPKILQASKSSNPSNLSSFQHVQAPLSLQGVQDLQTPPSLQHLQVPNPRVYI